MPSHSHIDLDNRVGRSRRGHPTAVLLLALAGWIGAAGPLRAQDADAEEPAPPPPVSIGGGLQTSFLHRTSDDADASQHFRVNSLRMYLNGAATSKIKFMVNTDIAYGGSLGAPGPQDTSFQILDAVAQFEMSDTFQRLGGPVPAPERPGQPLRPVLRPPLGGLLGRGAGRLPLRLPGARQRRRVVGDSSTRSSCRRARSTACRRPATRRSSARAASRSTSGTPSRGTT